MISKLDYNKTYYFLAKKGEVGGTGFVKLIKPVNNKIQYRNVVKYEDLCLEHPIYNDEMEMESYSEELKEFRQWHDANNITLAYSEPDYLKERLYEVKDIDTFPMCVEISGAHIVIGPCDKSFRDWQLHLLLEEDES